MTVDQQRRIRALEERSFNAWPARQTVLCNGWALRLSGGYTKRANSANALKPEGAFADVMAAAETFYAQHDLPTIFRLTSLAPAMADRTLERAGYRLLEPSTVMTAPLDGGGEIGGVAISAAPTPEWCAGFAAASNVAPAMRRVHDDMLASIALPAAFATIAEADGPVGYGIAVTEREMTGLFDIVVIETARGRGLGRQLTAALLQWGRSQGASEAYLQVNDENTVALSLYARLGFKEAYRYHYRIRE